MKIIAVVNDSNGEIQAVLEGHGRYFPFAGLPAERIEIKRQYGEVGEHAIVSIEMNGYEHIVSTEKYSLVYEKEVAE